MTYDGLLYFQLYQFVKLKKKRINKILPYRYKYVRMVWYNGEGIFQYTLAVKSRKDKQF